MFSCCLSVLASIHACICASVQDVFLAMSMVGVDGFSPNFCQLCILGRRWTDLGVKWSKVKVTAWPNCEKKYRFLGSFPQYLWCALMHFLQTFVAGASWDIIGWMIRFWGKNSQRSRCPAGEGIQPLTLMLCTWYFMLLFSTCIDTAFV